MSAVQIQQLPATNMTRLLDTMQIVESSKREPELVPNHLIKTKIYSKIGHSAVIEATPAVLHFAGFEPGQTCSQKLKLVNISSDVQRFHIIPPQSAYFRLTYSKRERIVPGLGVDCTIEFFPDEWRYYYDCIRVHCKNEANLIIPIHAYPVMNTSEFPQYITFPAVALGHVQSKTIPLRSIAPIDFDFQLTCLQRHPAFSISPMSGIVPANGDVDIMVTFAPREFSTARMVLQLVVSQFNSKPLICTITGSSAPGLARQMTIADSTSNKEDDTLDPRSLSPLDRLRYKKKIINKSSSLQQQSSQFRLSLFEEYGVMVPNNLDNPHAVAQVLNQEKGKLKMKYLRDAVEKGKSFDKHTRQMKETMFEMAVRQNLEEEKQNQLRWQVKIGEDPMTADARVEIIESRRDAQQEYLLKQGIPPPEVACNWEKSQNISLRPYRLAVSVPETEAKFDVYSNDVWAMKHDIITRFQNAARKVIMQQRAEKRLRDFRETVLNWKQTDKKRKKDEDDESTTAYKTDLTFDVHRLSTALFPTYTQPSFKNEMAVNSLGQVNCKSIEMSVKAKVPFFDLKVPQQYMILGYAPQNVHSASLNYVPPALARPLRSGAEDEVINVSVRTVSLPTPSPTTEEIIMPAEALKPPVVFFEPAKYPPLHIFNPCPNLQVFKQPLPYDETSTDFHLCPLPRYVSTNDDNPTACTQKKFLDQEDTIKGIMHWKRFPSLSLLSLSNTPTLSNVWVPRWSNPFGTDLLPTEGPVLLNDIPESFQPEIKDNIQEIRGAKNGDNIEYLYQLTPQLIATDFSLSAAQRTPEDSAKEQDAFPMGNKLPPTNAPVSSNGSVSRWQREYELVVFLSHKFNQTGSRVKSRLSQLSKLSSQPELVPQ